MAGKTKQKTVDQPFALSRMKILIGIAVVAAFAALAVGIVTLVGGSSLSKGPQKDPRPPGAIGPAPAIERSSAADLLANKTWDEMTQDERDNVKAEVTRIFDSSVFRATSPSGSALDVYRSDGLTKAVRQFSVIKTPGGTNVLQQSMIFYCPTPGGAPGDVDEYRVVTSVLGSQVLPSKSKFGRHPFDPYMTGLNWSAVSDLGLKDVNGERARGLQIRFNTSTGFYPVQHWFSVDTARLLERTPVDQDGTLLVSSGYSFDYRQFAPIGIPEDQQKPPCYDATTQAFNG